MPARVVSDALKHIWSLLQGLNLPVAVMGGIALARWQYVRATHDVDLLIELDMQDASSVLARLRAGGVHPKRTPAVIKLGSLSVLQRSYDAPSHLPIQIDLLIAEGEYHRAALSRRIAARLPELDLEVAVLTCEDLILHKLLAGRLIDRADCVALLKANRSDLDFQYLGDWIGKLALMPSFGEVWTDAFPGQPMPLESEHRA